MSDPKALKTRRDALVRALLPAFFFVSGCSGLVFEVIWSRMLTQVFGSTTFALSALLTAFMAGLALGSEWAGRRVEDIARPLRLYGILEGGIGLYALLVPVMLGVLPELYRPLFQGLYDNFYLFSLLRFGLVFFVLLVPTTFMGATLPLLASFVARRGEDWEGGSGVLYGVNTFGACVGTVACGFLLLPNLGLITTNAAIAGLSVTLCVCVLLADAWLQRAEEADADHERAEAAASEAARGAEPSASDAAQRENADEGAAQGVYEPATIDPLANTLASMPATRVTDHETPPFHEALRAEDAAATEEEDIRDLGAALWADEPERQPPQWAVWVILAAFAGAGAISMTYQVLWTRAYVIVLGSSTYSFSLILATFLVGLAGGSALMASLLRFVRRPVMTLALTQLGVCVFASVCFYTLNKVPLWLFEHLRDEGRSPANVYIYNVFLIALVVLAPTLLQGMGFPLVVRIVSDHARRIKAVAEAEAGRLVGRAYAINTVGAILGSFASGFVLMPLAGLRVAMTATIVANLVVGATVAAVSLRLGWRPSKAAILAPVLGLAVLLFALGPQLNLTRLSSGAFRVYWARELFTPRSFARDKPEVLFYRDGVAATITVEKRGRIVTLKSNGKPEASNDADMATQILVGLLPLVLHEGTETARAQREAGTYEGARDVAMVGFGSGVTAGASLTYPLERLDVVEIEAAMLDASRAFDEVNHAPLSDPRLRVIESDGRNFLEYTGQQYDVIVSEPSNPWIAGVASLFTEEHFLRARRKLKPGGVFCQWVQLYELRPENVTRIFKTFRAAFPHVAVFSSMAKGTDLILIGADEPLNFTEAGWPLAFSDTSVANELRRADVDDPYDIYALSFMTPDELDAFILAQERDLGHDIKLNTDDNGVLEFEAPLDLIAYKQADQFFARIYYSDKIHGDMRPLLKDFDDPAVWDADKVARLAFSAFAHGKQRLGGELAAEALRRGETRLARAAAAAWAIAQRGPGPYALEQWPRPGTRLHQIVLGGLEQGAPLPALEVIYGDFEREDEHFKDPEAALAAALFLYEVKDYKHAHEHLLHLKKSGTALGQEPFVDMMLGFTSTRRRRYVLAFGHFMRFHESQQP